MTRKLPHEKLKRGRWTDEQLREAVASSKSMTEVMAALGLHALTNSRVKRRIEELDLDTAHLPSKRRHPREKYTREALAAVVPECYSMSEVARRFGSRPVGSVTAHLRRQVDRFGISTEHFRTTSAGRPGHNRLTPEAVFVIRPEGSVRRDGADLRRMLIAVGEPYRCAECANDGTWRGKPMTLHVDHINGEWLDNRRENLRFLCPNCHSQTDTWRSRNHRSRKKPAAPALLV